jgi:hypothetical protein
VSREGRSGKKWEEVGVVRLISAIHLQGDPPKITIRSQIVSILVKPPLARESEERESSN